MKKINLHYKNFSYYNPYNNIFMVNINIFTNNIKINSLCFQTNKIITCYHSDANINYIYNTDTLEKLRYYRYKNIAYISSEIENEYIDINFKLQKYYKDIIIIENENTKPFALYKYKINQTKFGYYNTFLLFGKGKLDENNFIKTSFIHDKSQKEFLIDKIDYSYK